MEFDRAALKNKAKMDINGRVGTTFMAFLVPALITLPLAIIAMVILLTSDVVYIEFGDMILETYDTGPMYSVISFLESLLSIALLPITFVGVPAFFISIVKRSPDAKVKTIFSPFKNASRFFTAIGASFLIGIVVFLGILLLIIPGIILAYGYSMTGYVLADNPNMGVTQAMKRSREIMRGNKLKLFVFHLSFFGWIILAPFTLGILYIWLLPYMEAATANFYLNAAYPGALTPDGFTEPNMQGWPGGGFFGPPPFGGPYGPYPGGNNGQQGGGYPPCGYPDQQGGYWQGGQPNQQGFPPNQQGYSGQQNPNQNPYGYGAPPYGNPANNPPPPYYGQGNGTNGNPNGGYGDPFGYGNGNNNQQGQSRQPYDPYGNNTPPADPPKQYYQPPKPPTDKNSKK